MRICKVKGCDSKYNSKGYCKLHYGRKLKGIPIICKCKWCKKVLLTYKKYCNSSHMWKYKYNKDKDFRRKQIEKSRRYSKMHITGSFMGKRYSVYTNGVTEEMKEMLPKIKEKVLKDCIKNPSKYLYEKKKNGRNKMQKV